MRRCAYLTMRDLAGFYTYDRLTYAPLRQRGWAVTEVPWRQPNVRWGFFDAVVIRTTWDYQQAPGAFMQVLEAIDRSEAYLLNPLELVRWNVDKGYLRALEAQGVPVVPTRWWSSLTRPALTTLFEDFGTAQVVVKPTVGANADDTFWLNAAQEEAWAPALGAFADRPVMAQPFVQAVVDEGEFSLFFFDGAYSHAILKTPKPHDFRVQEEHGGHIQATQPSAALIAQAEQVVSALPTSSLYARVDLVRMPGDAFAVMEVELIEPSLYFSYDAASPVRFAEALVAWMDRS